MRQARWWQVLALLAVLAYVAWNVSAPTTEAPRNESSRTEAPRSGGTVADGQLPAEALETLDLVDAGGPFPYARDGVTFMNRERLLPQRPRGYWREYTVPTPGESDRGARRLVVGRGGETYYTDDHYASFQRVDRGTG